ncbi:MAG: DUF669 domain-containing protein [Clostridiales bacterium]|nr:DUF669 domain-containing protein [Clostridiales bacterium]
MDIEREFGWDDYIENDSQGFVLLPEGDYDFVVTKFERSRHNGSAKLPPCNKAVLTLEIKSDEGTVYINHNLFLHSKTEGMLCAFFTAIGARKKGEKLKMDWSKVTGAKGRCRVGIHEYTKKDGTIGKINDIKYFHEPPEKAQEPAKPYGAYTPGNF